MGFASKVFFLLGLAAAALAFPAHGEAAPPTIAHVKRVLNAELRCSWDENAAFLTCIPKVRCGIGYDFRKSPDGDRVGRIEMLLPVRYDPRDRRQERLNIACTMKVIDLYFPNWKGSHAWFAAAVSGALKDSQKRYSRRVGDRKISVEQSGTLGVPWDGVIVTIE